MNLVQAVLDRAKAVPEAFWQVSAVPAQAVRGRSQERGGWPFLAVVTGTAALGLVDWPVALLVAGGYVLVHRQPVELSQPASSGPSVPPAPPEARPSPATPTPRPSGAAPGSRRRAPTPTPPRAKQPPSTAPTAAETTDPAPADAERPATAPIPASARKEDPLVPAAAQTAKAETQALPVSGSSAASASSAAALAEPWPGYDAMTVPRVLERLDKAGTDQAAVGRYEASHRNRKMVQAAIAARQSRPPA